MQEYVCLTLVGRSDEAEAAFKGRLVAFWTHLLRTRPDDYEKVYSEAVEFEDGLDGAHHGPVEPVEGPYSDSLDATRSDIRHHAF